MMWPGDSAAQKLRLARRGQNKTKFGRDQEFYCLLLFKDEPVSHINPGHEEMHHGP